VRGVDEVRDALELAEAAPAGRFGERAQRHPVGLGGQLPGSIDSELAHVCALAVTLIAASRLSQCIVGTCDVEYVVDDLEQYAQLGGETTKGHCLTSMVNPAQH